jgi:predicted component of type VI protein secretion system
LLGTNNAVETIRILQDHAVEFGRSELDRMIDRSLVKPPQVAEPSESVMKVEPTPDAAPEWFHQKRSGEATITSASRPKPATASAPATPVKAKDSSKSAAAPVQPAGGVLPVLVLIDLSSGRRLTCRKYPLRFGSGAQNQLQHAQLKSKHCAITCEAGRICLVPLTDGAAIRVNEVTVKQPVRLKAGDVLKLGPVSFQVESL